MKSSIPTDNATNQEIAIVLPVNANTIATPRTINDIRSIMRSLRMPWKIVIVRNGPIKRHLGEYLDAICFSEASLHCVHLAAEVPARLAIQAGLDSVSADAYIPIAADGSEDPRTITEFIRKWRKGADVVLAVRDAETDGSRLSRWARAAYRLVGRRCSVPVVYHASNFCLMDRKVVEVLKNEPSDQQSLSQHTAKLGFRRSLVGMEHTWHRRPSFRARCVNHIRTLREALLSHSRTPIRLLYVGAALVTSIALLGTLGAAAALAAGVSATTVAACLIMAIAAALGPMAIGMVVLGEYLYRLIQVGPGLQHYSVAASAERTCEVRRRERSEIFSESLLLQEVNSLRLEVEQIREPAAPPVATELTS